MDSIGIMFFFASFYAYLKQKTAFLLPWHLQRFYDRNNTYTPFMIIFMSGSQESYLGNVCGSICGMWEVWQLSGCAIFIVHVTTRGPYLANSFYLTMVTMTKVLVEYVKVLVCCTYIGAESYYLTWN